MGAVHIFDRRAIRPADRLLQSHRLVEKAAIDLHDGAPGSGVKALAFAAATHLALTIGPEQAKTFFNMIAGVAGQVQMKPDDEPEPAA